MFLSGIQTLGGDIPTVPERKSKSIDSRLRISGMTTGGGGFPIKDLENDRGEL